ncbi:hypothetical protein B0H19DRAFT_939414, partial [Mycena capillaripes]
PPDDWNPSEDEVQFRTAHFLFRRVEMSQGNVDYLLQLLHHARYDHAVVVSV